MVNFLEIPISFKYMYFWCPFLIPKHTRLNIVVHLKERKNTHMKGLHTLLNNSRHIYSSDKGLWKNSYQGLSLSCPLVYRHYEEKFVSHFQNFGHVDYCIVAGHPHLECLVVESQRVPNHRTRSNFWEMQCFMSLSRSFSHMVKFGNPM